MDIEYIVLEQLDSSKNKEIIHFANEVLNHDVTPQVWDWEFNSIDGTLFTIAKDGEQIAGTQSMLYISIYYGTELINSAKSETSYLSSDYRGKKIFEKLYQLAVDKTVEKGSKLIWGFTPAVNAWKKNLGFYVYEDSMSIAVIHSHYFSPSDIFKKSRNPIFGLGKYLVNQRKNAAFRATYKKVLSTNISLTPKASLNNHSDINKLIDVIRSLNNNLVSLSMDEDYYKWRITDNPAIEYKEIFFYDENILVGYLIYSVHGDQIAIADATYNMNTEVIKYMLQHLLQLHKDCFSFSYWGNKTHPLNTVIFGLMQALGASESTDSGRNFVFQVYDNTIDTNKLQDLSNWYMNGLWTEGFDI